MSGAASSASTSSSARAFGQREPDLRDSPGPRSGPRRSPGAPPRSRRTRARAESARAAERAERPRARDAPTGTGRGRRATPARRRAAAARATAPKASRSLPVGRDARRARARARRRGDRGRSAARGRGNALAGAGAVSADGPRRGAGRLGRGAPAPAPAAARPRGSPSSSRTWSLSLAAPEDRVDELRARLDAAVLEPALDVGEAAHRADLDHLVAADHARGHARVDAVGEPVVALLARLDDRGGVDAGAGAERVAARRPGSCRGSARRSPRRRAAQYSRRRVRSRSIQPSSCRLTSSWSIGVLPTRSPMPSAQAWTRCAPASSAQSALITPSPRSWWPCQSILTSGLTSSTTSATKRTRLRDAVRRRVPDRVADADAAARRRGSRSCTAAGRGPGARASCPR